MKRPSPRSLVVFLVTFATSSLIAGVFLEQQHGFGKGDLRAFAFWTLFFSLFVAFAEKLFSRLTARRGLMFSLIGAFFAGFVVVAAYFFLFVFALGIRVLAMSFPAQWAWLGGSLCSFLALTAWTKAKKGRWALIFSGVVLSFLVAFAAQPLMSVLLRERIYHVLTFRHEVTPHPLKIDDQLSEEAYEKIKKIYEDFPILHLEPSDLKLLEALRLTGTLKLQENSELGTGGRTVKVIIIAHSPEVKPAKLPLPDHDTVVYYQDGDRMTMYPPDAETLDLTIKFVPMDDPHEMRPVTGQWPTLGYWIEHWTGVRFGGGISFPPVRP